MSMSLDGNYYYSIRKYDVVGCDNNCGRTASSNLNINLVKFKEMRHF